MISNRWKILAAALPIIGTLAMAQPQPGGLGGFYQAWYGDSTIPRGPKDYLHFWNPASLDESDFGTGGNNATSYNFDPDAANGWNMGTADNKYVQLNAPITNGISYTITMWIKPDVTAMNLNNNGGWFISEQSGASNNDFQLDYIKNNRTRFLVYDASSSFQSDINTNIQDNIWQHFAAVVDSENDTIEVWIDGQSDGSSSFTLVPGNTFGGSTTIGGFSISPSSSARKFHGSIGKVRYYNRALSQEEILAEISSDGNTGP